MVNASREGVIDAEAVKRDFPLLATEMNGKPLVYLDSAATSQKPKAVIDAIADYYSRYNANIHRGIYKLSELATDAYVESKQKAAKFINAEGTENIVYTRNATESLNLVALTYAAQNVRAGDHILITEMEHHSNMVPWQLLARRSKATLDYVKVDPATGLLSEESLKEGLGRRPKVVAVTHASNVLGTINDVKSITKQAHEIGAAVLVDGAQSVPHMPVDVKDIGCDFLAFSAHKMLGPTGLGVLYAKAELLNITEPLIAGGDMIRTVTFDSSTWNDLPWKFEAGTPNIAGAVGFGASLEYLDGIGMDRIASHETSLTRYALEQLGSMDGVSVFGPGIADADRRVGVVSFSVNGVHAHDVAQIFDNEGIAIRGGHHCAMPLVRQVLKCDSVSRMSFYLYNSEADVDRAADAIRAVQRTFRVHA